MKNVRSRAASTPAIPDRAARMDALEHLCRDKVSEIIQAFLVAEADEFLGRIAGVPARSQTGYRDGYEEPRTIAFGSVPATVRRPRVRDSEVPFESELLPAYKRRFPKLDKTVHELWIQGLSTRDFEPALRPAWRDDAAFALDDLAREQAVSRRLPSLVAEADRR